MNFQSNFEKPVNQEKDIENRVQSENLSEDIFSSRNYN
jgi:hypothetical protein